MQDRGISQCQGKKGLINLQANRSSVFTFKGTGRIEQIATWIKRGEIERDRTKLPGVGAENDSPWTN